jgi:hypothetical protein
VVAACALHSNFLPLPGLVFFVDLDLVCVLANVGVYGFLDEFAFAACDTEDKIV